MATPTTLPSSFTAGQVLTAAQMNNLRGAFRVLQVVTVSKTDTFTTTSTTFTDLTGLSLSITPSATSSKVLVGFCVTGAGTTGSNMGGLNLVRGSTNILLGDAAGSRVRATNLIPEAPTGSSGFLANVYLDSPATTSATTYKLQVASGVAGQTLFINRTNSDIDNANWFRFASTMFAMEISA